MRLFKLISKKTNYHKIKLPSFKSDLYLIFWNPNSRSKIHNHNGKKCNFVLLNGYLNEYIYENKNYDSLKDYNSLKPFTINYIDDSIGYHQIMNIENKTVITLNRYI